MRHWLAGSTTYYSVRVAGSRIQLNFDHLLKKTLITQRGQLAKTMLSSGSSSSALSAAAFQHALPPRMGLDHSDLSSPPLSPRRRQSFTAMGAAGGASGFLSYLFGDGGGDGNAANAATTGNVNGNKGPTNEVIKSVNGMRQRRLGGSDIVVSELGLVSFSYVSVERQSAGIERTRSSSASSISCPGHAKMGLRGFQRSRQGRSVRLSRHCDPERRSKPNRHGR